MAERGHSDQVRWKWWENMKFYPRQRVIKINDMCEYVRFQRVVSTTANRSLCGSRGVKYYNRLSVIFNRICNFRKPLSRKNPIRIFRLKSNLNLRKKILRSARLFLLKNLFKYIFATWLESSPVRENLDTLSTSWLYFETFIWVSQKCLRMWNFSFPLLLVMMP